MSEDQATMRVLLAMREEIRASAEAAERARVLFNVVAEKHGIAEVAQPAEV